MKVIYENRMNYTKDREKKAYVPISIILFIFIFLHFLFYITNDNFF